MRCALALSAGLLLASCSATGGKPVGQDASADVSMSAPDAQPDRLIAEAREDGPELSAGDRPEVTLDLAGDAPDATVDVAVPASDASSETADWLCPGHRDPCLAGDCNPYVRIATADGSASITSVRVRTGGCVIDKIATTSGGDLRAADGGFQAVAGVVVFVDSTCVPTTDCDFEVSFANGASAVITSRYSQGPSIRERFCIDNANCCPPSLYVDTVGYPCGFWPWEFVVDVPVRIDGGVPPMDGGPASLDGNPAGG